MAGRKPIPSAMKELAGKRDRNPNKGKEPKFGGTPKCPPHLDKAAKAEWRRISKELEAVGLLTAVDRAALAAYCQAYSRWAAAEENIAKFGLVIKSPKSGFPIPNPYVGIANTALDMMRKFLVEFGMTPSSRSRLHVESNNTDADPFATFMESIGGAEITTQDDHAEEPVQ